MSSRSDGHSGRLDSCGGGLVSVNIKEITTRTKNSALGIHTNCELDLLSFVTLETQPPQTYTCAKIPNDASDKMNEKYQNAWQAEKIGF